MKQASIDNPDKPRRLVRQESIHDAEAESSFLCPRVEGRIFILSDEVGIIMIVMIIIIMKYFI